MAEAENSTVSLKPLRTRAGRAKSRCVPAVSNAQRDDMYQRMLARNETKVQTTDFYDALAPMRALTHQMEEKLRLRRIAIERAEQGLPPEEPPKPPEKPPAEPDSSAPQRSLPLPPTAVTSTQEKAIQINESEEYDRLQELSKRMAALLASGRGSDVVLRVVNATDPPVSDCLDFVKHTSQGDDIDFEVHFGVVANACTSLEGIHADGGEDERRTESGLRFRLAHDPFAIVLLNTSALGVAACLRYIYSGELTLTDDNAMDILSAAIRLDCEQLVRRCDAYVLARERAARYVTLQHVCLLFETAVSNEDVEVAEACAAFIRENGNEIFASVTLMDLSMEAVALLACDPNLRADPKVVYDGVIDWAKMHCSRSELHGFLQLVLPQLNYTPTAEEINDADPMMETSTESKLEPETEPELEPLVPSSSIGVWNPRRLCEGIVIEANGHVARRTGGQDTFAGVFSADVENDGRHYWELTIRPAIVHGGVFLGVLPASTDLATVSSLSGSIYTCGFRGAGRFFYIDTGDFAEVHAVERARLHSAMQNGCKLDRGDRIGLLVDFNASPSEALTIYVNNSPIRDDFLDLAYLKEHGVSVYVELLSVGDLVEIVKLPPPASW